MKFIFIGAVVLVVLCFNSAFCEDGDSSEDEIRYGINQTSKIKFCMIWSLIRNYK